MTREEHLKLVKSKLGKIPTKEFAKLMTEYFVKWFPVIVKEKIDYTLIFDGNLPTY